MKQIKAFFGSRTIGFYILPFSIILEAVSLVLYSLNGINEFAPKLDNTVFIVGIIGIIFAFLSQFYENKILREFSFLTFLYSLIAYIGSQANLIASIFVSIDDTAIPFSFLLTCIFLLLSVITSFVSIFFSKKKEDVTMVVTSDIH